METVGEIEWTRMDNDMMGNGIKEAERRGTGKGRGGGGGRVDDVSKVSTFADNRSRAAIN